MGIRDRLNQSPVLAIVIAGVVVVITAFLIFGRSRSFLGGSSDQIYFSNDDGATWFADDTAKYPPFMKDGKEAVRANVYECEGKKYVAYLERFTPERVKFLQAKDLAMKQGKPLPVPPVVNGPSFVWGSEVKKPGDPNWTPAGDFANAGKITHVVCPNGGGDPQPVLP